MDSVSAGAKPLTKKVLASYSGLAIPTAAMAMPIAVYLPPFYSEGLGLSLATVGTVFTVARIWDVVTDPIMGMAIDRFDTRWGRRKHWIALSIPILLISVWAVFIPNPANVTPMYLLGWLVALYVGYTMLSIAHLSWGAELSSSYDDRSRLFGWREIFVIGGMMTVLGIPAALDFFSDADINAKVASMGWFCLILFPLTAVANLLFVPDSQRPTKMSIDWWQAMKIIARNRVLWRLLAADLTSGFGTGVAGALYIFVAAYVFDLREHASIALLFYFLASFLAMPMWMRLATRWGKDTSLKAALVYGGLVMFVLLVTAQKGSVIGLWGFTIFYGIAYGAAPALLRSMMADLTDEDELHTGENRAGLFYALLTTTNKLGAALAVGACFYTIEVVFGFAAGPNNSQDAIDGLLITYCFGTGVGLLLAYFTMIGYPLNRQKHTEIRAQLDQIELSR